MAEVHIVDIDGEQWDIKDMPLNKRVEILEQLLTVETKENEVITLEPGFSAPIKRIINIVQFGNIVQCNFSIINLTGNGIGSNTSVKFGNCSLKGKSSHDFILRDDISGNTVSLSIASNGDIYLTKSAGITSGRNTLRGSIMIIIQ